MVVDALVDGDGVSTDSGVTGTSGVRADCAATSVRVGWHPRAPHSRARGCASVRCCHAALRQQHQTCWSAAVRPRVWEVPQELMAHLAWEVPQGLGVRRFPRFLGWFPGCWCVSHVLWHLLHGWPLGWGGAVHGHIRGSQQGGAEVIAGSLPATCTATSTGAPTAVDSAWARRASPPRPANPAARPGEGNVTCTVDPVTPCTAACCWAMAHAGMDC